MEMIQTLSAVSGLLAVLIGSLCLKKLLKRWGANLSISNSAE